MSCHVVARPSMLVPSRVLLVLSRPVLSCRVMSEHVGLVTSSQIQSRLVGLVASGQVWSSLIWSWQSWSHWSHQVWSSRGPVLSRWSRLVRSSQVPSNPVSSHPIALVTSHQVPSSPVRSGLGTSCFTPLPPDIRHRECRCGNAHAAPGRCEWLSPDTLPNRRPRQTRAPVPAGP